ncbi:MAG: HpaII family restriction endonuclease [Muribaculaceae bacterium]|nr:HpaII family restriction endonuclease [Muribaculaceae bacterium]
MSEYKQIKGNVGEWSEIYTLLKLLGESKVYAGDQNLEKIKNLVYPIIMIIRSEKGGIYDYRVESADIVITTSDGEELLRLPASKFLFEAEALLKAINEKPAGARSFPVARTQAFMDRIYCTSLKASSSDKTDIHIILHDQRTKINNEMGFSIKSQLGGDSTLLNASSATNFVYRIEGCYLSNDEIAHINAIDTRSKIIDRIGAIVQKGGKLVFEKIDNDIFRRNLDMIDLGLGATIAQLLLEQFNTRGRMFEELTDTLAQSNPLGFDEADAVDVYTYKLKKLLTSAALGMMPSKKWNGKYDANGGYLVVKKDGEILCYHFYDQNRFEDFLFKNAYLERGKTHRHGYASLYRKENDKVYFKLNLQIRLK